MTKSNRREEKDSGYNLKRGEIVSGLETVIPCFILEISADGARLRVESPSNVPRTFMLFIDLDGFAAECVVTWREAREVVIRFQALHEVEEVYDPESQFGKQKMSGLRRSAPKVLQLTKAAEDEPVGKPPITTSPGPIVIADDDPDDRMLLRDAFRKGAYSPPLEFVEDGQELLDYLSGEGSFNGKERPGLILLDLNMPRIDGRAALVRIKKHPEWRTIPVMILSTSHAALDMDRTCKLGANTYIHKPSSFDDLVELAKSVSKFWFACVGTSTAGDGGRGTNVGRRSDNNEHAQV